MITVLENFMNTNLPPINHSFEILKVYNINKQLLLQLQHQKQTLLKIKDELNQSKKYTTTSLSKIKEHAECSCLLLKKITTNSQNILDTLTKQPGVYTNINDIEQIKKEMT